MGTVIVSHQRYNYDSRPQTSC